MKFLVTGIAFDTLTPEQAKPLRASMGPQIQQMFASPKIKEVGAFADARGLYMILDDVDSAHEIPEILGPELMDIMHHEVHPIMSVEQQGELFVQWAQQGR